MKGVDGSEWGALKWAALYLFSNINAWWVNAESRDQDWTDIKILEKKDLTLAGLRAKLVAFEFTNKLGGKRIERTYHIYRPGADYDLFRIRMNCIKERYEWFLPTVEKLAGFFTLINKDKTTGKVAGSKP